MTSIVRLPEPPYYAVIAPAVLHADVRGYPEMGAKVIEAASEVDGFHGIELCAQPGFSLAVSYWASLDAIDTWRHHHRHEQAKELGRTRWFSGYATRIAQVIDAY
jgi:heme-degrading monooxygenase HmoA